MALINTFSTDENFWVLYPQFQTVQPFKDLYKKDRSKNKYQSSKVAWFVTQVIDTSSKNVFRNLVYEERLSLLSQDFMGDVDYYDKHASTLQPLIDFYTKLHMTAARKALKEWEEKMIDRSEFIKNTPYSEDSYEQMGDKWVKQAGTAKMLDDMMKNSKGIFDLYQQILKSLDEEGEGSQVKGGRTLSLSDTKKI